MSSDLAKFKNTFGIRTLTLLHKAHTSAQFIWSYILTLPDPSYPARYIILQFYNRIPNKKVPFSV